MRYRIELEYDNNTSVHGFLSIVPWALEAITKLQYLGIDKTFEITKPYVLSCPQIIVNGRSLLFGFIVGAKENWTLLNSFYKELLKLISSKVPLLNLPVLSDQGSGIHKFCNLNGILQYFCIRHIISDVGANYLCPKP